METLKRQPVDQFIHLLGMPLVAVAVAVAADY
jgi:hypothetical protein